MGQRKMERVRERPGIRGVGSLAEGERVGLALESVNGCKILSFHVPKSRYEVGEVEAEEQRNNVVCSTDQD